MSSKQCSIAVRHGFFSIVVLFQTIFEKLLRQNLFIRSDPFNRANPLHVTYVAVMSYLLAWLLSRAMCTGVIIESRQCSGCLTTWSLVASCELTWLLHQSCQGADLKKKVLVRSFLEGGICAMRSGPLMHATSHRHVWRNLVPINYAFGNRTEKRRGHLFIFAKNCLAQLGISVPEQLATLRALKWIKRKLKVSCFIQVMVPNDLKPMENMRQSGFSLVNGLIVQWCKSTS
jgi:hypothetical protein